MPVLHPQLQRTNNPTLQHLPRTGTSGTTPVMNPRQSRSYAGVGSPARVAATTADSVAADFDPAVR
jgi:hypothetical protein